MRNELLGIVLETEEFITILVDMGGELVLDALPSGEVSGVLVAVLPDGAPRLEHRSWRGGSDLGWGGEPALQEAANHQGMGLRVESVELGGDMGIGTNIERLVMMVLVGIGGIRVRGLSGNVIVLVGGVRW